VTTAPYIPTTLFVAVFSHIPETVQSSGLFRAVDGVPAGPDGDVGEVRYVR
jgi:hypothetical protein